MGHAGFVLSSSTEKALGAQEYWAQTSKYFTFHVKNKQTKKQTTAGFEKPLNQMCDKRVNESLYIVEV